MSRANERRTLHNGSNEPAKRVAFQRTQNVENSHRVNVQTSDPKLPKPPRARAGGHDRPRRRAEQCPILGDLA
eukprot:8247143-Lingulodinium_polyedra.AAC.1